MREGPSRVCRWCVTTIVLIVLVAGMSSLAATPHAAPSLAPANCTAILLSGGSIGDGVYVIDPAQDGNNVNVYCDMTTAGGGWTLAGYGANANLAGKLTVANGAYNPTNRAGSANINALALARSSTEVSLSWSNAAANGGLGSYSQAVSYVIPNPPAQSLDPQAGGYQCLSAVWSPVTVNRIVGNPNLPALMYTRTASLGAVYGLAYGLSRSNGNPQCDWTIDGQGFRAVYLGINSPAFARGVVYEPGGSGNHVTPATMAIWFRGNTGQGLPGLVARYSFDASDAADSSGNGHHGTVFGGATFGSGPNGFGNALNVDLGKYVALPSTAALNLYDHDFTVAAWVNASAFGGLGGYGGDWAVLGNQLPNPVQGSAGLHLVLRGGQPYMGFFGNDIGSGVNLSLNQWYHIAWRYTKAGGEMALFLNGSQISAGGGHAPFVGTGATYIGRCCETWDAPRYAKGQIDDVQIYGRPLTSTEIASLMSAPPPMDSTPPTITPVVTGTLGTNGWYISDVTISWNVTDDESTPTPSGCGTQVVTSDTAGATFTCVASSAGGSATQSVTVKRDATAPSISGSRAPAANAFGWNNGDVAVTFTCSDGGSGISSCVGGTTLSGEGAGQSATGTSTDLAGNMASATVGGINIDKTAPVVTITSPQNGGTYTLNQAVTASYSCSDGLSGLTDCVGTVASGAAVDTASVGTKSLSASGVDQAGNASTSTVTYAVRYAFGGFRQPIPLPVSTFKGGSTIPVKFTLANALGSSVGTAAATVSVNGGSSLGAAVYDAVAQQYHFNLKTKGLPLGPLTITVTLDDGTTHSVVVALK